MIHRLSISRNTASVVLLSSAIIIHGAAIHFRFELGVRPSDVTLEFSRIKQRRPLDKAVPNHPQHLVVSNNQMRISGPAPPCNDITKKSYSPV